MANPIGRALAERGCPMTFIVPLNTSTLDEAGIPVSGKLVDMLEKWTLS